MKRSSLAFGLGLVFVGVTFGQTTTAGGSGSASVSASVGSSLESAIYVTGTLSNSISTKKAKVGDEVVLKTTSVVKQNGKTILDKGSRLVGRVTEVQKKMKSTADSSLTVVFDSIVQNGQFLPITAVITSVISTTSGVSTGDDMFASASSSSTTSTATSSGGSLLGGVTNTAGGLLSTTTNAVGSVAGTASKSVDGVTGMVSTTVKGLSITNSTGASAEGSSTLSMKGRDLHLEKGTRFNLSVMSSTSLEKQ